ncbi:MAG: Sip1-related alpha-galactosidase [Algisphaera sp.]
MQTSLSFDDVVRGLPVDETGFAALNTSATKLTLPKHGRLMALERYEPFWLEPKMLDQLADVPADTLLLIWERDDPAAPFGAMVPLAAGKRRASISGHGDSLQIDVQGLSDAAADPVVVIGAGQNPRQLVDHLMAQAQARLGTFALRASKAQPTWADGLGWCTWDAFYQDVTEEGVIQGLEKLRDAGVRPRFIILDDGWLQHDKYRLTQLEPDPVKFPSGLASLIQRVKGEFGVEQFGIWHALQGYWMGLDPNGPLADTYRIIKRPVNKWNFWGIPNHVDNTLGTIHPDDIGRFFDDWHTLLAGYGVDMIKVDNQGSMQAFGGEESDTGINRTELAKTYQRALQTSAKKHFKGGLLNCMSMDNTLACSMQWGSVIRNSDDYYPRKATFQGKHIHRNAKNALWTNAFAIADWDMFQTRHPAAQFHAAARAISGGPVYVSDKPGDHDTQLLQSLAGRDGHVLRYNGGSAMATTDCWFVDAGTQPKLLKVCNTHHLDSTSGSADDVAIGVLGLFHCQWVGDGEPDAESDAPKPVNQAQPITDTWTPTDVNGLKGERFAAWSPMSQSLRVVDAHQSIPCTLSSETAELVQLVPIVNDYAPLGLVDRLNGGAAFDTIKEKACRIKASGTFGAYAKQAPTRVEINGIETPFDYDAQTCLLTTTVAGDAPFDIQVH